MKIDKFEEKTPKIIIGITLLSLIISLLSSPENISKNTLLGLVLMVVNPIVGFSGVFLSFKNKKYDYLILNFLLAIGFFIIISFFTILKNK